MVPAMFGERARVYDLIYDSKDYEGEADTLRDLLEREGVEEGSTVVEAACGTGRYLQWLDGWYDVAGFDISSQMLEIARRRLDGSVVYEADMETHVADEPVEALVCLFSSIGYVHGKDKLRRTFQNFYASLIPGGVVVIEPWVLAGNLEAGRPRM